MANYGATQVITNSGKKAESPATSEDEEMVEFSLGVKVPDVVEATGEDLNVLNAPAANNAVGIASAVASLCNIIVGAGIVGIPYAIRVAGLVYGIIGVIISAVVSSFTLYYIIVLVEITGQISYAQIFGKLYGRPMFFVTKIVQVLVSFGAIVAYVVLIGDTFGAVLQHWMFKGTAWESWAPAMAILGFYAAIISWVTLLPRFRNLKHLGAVSVVSLISSLSVGAFLFINLLASPIDLTLISVVQSAESIHPGILDALSIIAFALVSHQSAPLIYKQMHEATPRKWKTVVIVSMTLCSFFVLSVGLIGYLTFTFTTPPNIINAFKVDTPEGLTLRTIFPISLCLTLMSEFFVAREATIDFLADTGYNVRGTYWIITTVMTVAMLGIAIVLGNRIDLVLEMVGGVCGSAVAYFFISLAVLTVIVWPRVRHEHIIPRVTRIYAPTNRGHAACWSFVLLLILIGSGLLIVQTLLSPLLRVWGFYTL